MQIFESFRNIFAIPDLRKRVLFTLGLLAIYRVGSHIPTPGLDASALEEFFKASAGGLLGFLDVFSGGALRRLSVFALGITPYITASIILQLLTVVWPYLEKLSKEGEMGRRKITQYTRYGTVVLSVVQGAGIALWLWSQTTPSGRNLALRDPGSDAGKLAFVLLAILTLTTGSSLAGGAREMPSRAISPDATCWVATVNNHDGYKCQPPGSSLLFFCTTPRTVCWPIIPPGPVLIDPNQPISLVDPNAPGPQFTTVGQHSAFKTSTGVEIRFFMPVLNVPFRLIFYWDPQRWGVRDNNLQPQQAYGFRFAVGSTF